MAWCESLLSGMLAKGKGWRIKRYSLLVVAHLGCFLHEYNPLRYTHTSRSFRKQCRFCGGLRTDENSCCVRAMSTGSKQAMNT